MLVWRVEFYQNNIDNLDICTIAPSIDNCHSINERVSISSTKRVYDWLKETLIEYNKIKIGRAHV